jgi:hypothetical protein
VCTNAFAMICPPFDLTGVTMSQVINAPQVRRTRVSKIDTAKLSVCSFQRAL